MTSEAPALLLSDEEARKRVMKVYSLLLALAEQDTLDVVDQPADQHTDLPDDRAARQEGEG